MSVNSKLYRTLLFGCSMYIKYEVPQMKPKPTAKQCVDEVMRRTRTRKNIDIDNTEYSKLIDRAKTKLDSMQQKQALLRKKKKPAVP